MTKAWEHPENECVDQVKKEAARTGRDIASILEEMLRKAKETKHKAQKVRIQRAEKFLKVRNKQKRRRKK